MANKYVLINKLPMGIPGDVTRRADAIISNRVNGAATTINFGDLVAINADNTVGIFTGTNFKGVAVTNIRANLAVDQMEGEYRQGDFTDVLERGSVLVKFDSTTGTPAAGGPVYYNITDGKAVITADTAATALENVVFTTGYTDDEGVIEITINTRN